MYEEENFALNADLIRKKIRELIYYFYYTFCIIWFFALGAISFFKIAIIMYLYILIFRLPGLNLPQI